MVTNIIQIGNSKGIILPSEILKQLRLSLKSAVSISLDPTRGGEMAKTRPCVVVTPSDLNMYLTTVVIVPITSTIRNYPYRVLCSVAGREGEIATDQIRTVDKSRIKRKIGELNNREIEELKEVFRQMFCE